MSNIEYNRKQTVKYLIWTFVLAYIMQIGVWLLYSNGNSLIGQLLTAMMMFVPTLGVVLSGHKLSKMGWKLQIQKNIKIILIAWFVPLILTAIGAGLYFLIFSGHFDISGNYLAKIASKEVVAQLETQGISYPVYLLISVIGSITYAPLINMFFGLGEEIGWRGFLYPQLKARFGRRKGLILGGIIWGAWHWPLIWLIGYEYGTEYMGFPVVGMLLFCVFTVAVGILCDWLYEKSNSIWMSSLCHGAINAAATIPIAVCLPDTGYTRILGPIPNGILAGLPFLIVAVILLLQKQRKTSKG